MGINRSYLKDKFQKKQSLQTGDEVKGPYKYINVPQTVYGSETKEQQWKRSDKEDNVNRLVSPRGDIYTQGFKYPAYEGPYALPKRDNVYDFLNKPDYEGYFQTGGEESTGDQVSKFPLKPEEIEYYYKFNLPEKSAWKSEFNAALVPGGSPEVQKYQKMLNEKYGTFLVEEGAWGPKTQAAYEKYIVNKEQPPAFTSTHFRPTLEEFKSIYERIPSYNYGYESLYDADPKNIYVQQGPLTKERTEQIQALPSEEQLRQSYLGKTFGGLPMFHAFGIYGGYSPTRTWTGKNPYIDNKYGMPLLKSEKPLYAYILSPKPGTQPDKVLTNPVTKEDLLKDPEAVKNTYKYIAKNASTIDNYKRPYIGTDSYSFLDFADKINSFTDEDWANPEKVKSITDYSIYQDTLFGNYSNLNLKIPYAEQCWGCSKTMESELLANPEIVKYTKEKGLDLANAKYTFTNEYGNVVSPNFAQNQLAEAVLAKRWNDVNKTPLVMSPTGSKPVIQDPDAFNLSGYLPLTEDMFYIDSDGYPRANWDDAVKRKEYLKKAGVPEDMMDKVLIHTSPFPIQEYKPRTNEKGEIYKKGGKVKSKLKNSYKNKRG